MPLYQIANGVPLSVERSNALRLFSSATSLGAEWPSARIVRGLVVSALIAAMIGRRGMSQSAAAAHIASSSA
jgi:hypothetical protein